MTSENAKYRDQVIITAPMGTPCGWTNNGGVSKAYTCGGGRPNMAVHILTETLPVAEAGTALCAYHSPFDPTDAERKAISPIAVHKLSAPMVSVLVAVASMRGEVDAAHMYRSILPTGTGTNKATLKALMRRGLLSEVIRDNDGVPGSLVVYVLTGPGLASVAALGCPVTFLPTDPREADAEVAEAGYVSCDQECAQITAAGPSALPVGGMVCFGCGSVFVRSGEDAHPGTLAVSEAVIRRNRRKGLI